LCHFIRIVDLFMSTKNINSSDKKFVILKLSN
jgi:hypothetical protein